MGETTEKHVGNNIGVQVAQNRGAFSVLANRNDVYAPVYFNCILTLMWLVTRMLVPGLLGLNIESLPNGIFEHVTVFDLVFNPQLPSTMRLLNAEELAPKLLTLMKAEMRPFRDEAWYRDLIETTSTQYPLFQAIWAQIPDDLEMVPIRTVGPIRFQYDADTVLSFTIYGTDFINDPRFRVVQYHPADPTTITIWNQWVVEEMAKPGGG